MAVAVRTGLAGTWANTLGVTIGEVSDVFREIFGVHRDPAYL